MLKFNIDFNIYDGKSRSYGFAEKKKSILTKS